MKTMIILFVLAWACTVSAQTSLLGEWEGYWDGRQDMKIGLVVSKISAELVEPDPPRPISESDPVPVQDEKLQIKEIVHIQYLYGGGQIEQDMRLTRYGGILKFSSPCRIPTLILASGRREFVMFLLSFEFTEDGKLTGTIESQGTLANRLIRKAVMKKIK